MSKTVIRVENLGKLYKLGEVGTGTISHDLNRWWAKMRGKEDPYGRIGELNDRTSKGNSDYVWALKDVNFDVKQGEVLGIIGRNGAGKSTLLKLLSKVTTPSAGKIKVKGRIASLLEVGTGFHPELTGRENIFLNGAILGMTKGEIRSKFDEIVDFSGVERYIDTPVKRYSSGMYVRLAFAVAAFLEPEILIIDEVLAVGDAEFQKKCLGRMKDVSENEGRTVLFVSHNLTAVRKLCTSAAFFSNGQLIDRGGVNEVINKYLNDSSANDGELIRSEADIKDKQKVFIQKASLLNEQGEVITSIDNISKAYLALTVKVLEEGVGYNFSFELRGNEDECIFSSAFFDTHIHDLRKHTWKKGYYTHKVEIPVHILREGHYFINIASAIPAVEVLDIFPGELKFKVNEVSTPMLESGEGRNGIIMQVLPWHTTAL
jgi:lipopolysaccharide transport system ATP-binding protein